MQGLRLERSAAFISCSDPTGFVRELRMKIQMAAVEGGSKDLTTVQELVTAAGYKAPGIIHSSFIRFLREISEEAEVTALQKAFTAAAEAWKPLQLECSGLTLVEETAPYMHLDLDGKDRDRRLGEFPFI